MGWSTLINISGTKLDLVFHFARFLREEPQMVHFAMDSVCLWISHLPSHHIYYQRTIKVIRKSFVGIIPSEKIEDWSRLWAASRQEKENHVVH